MKYEEIQEAYLLESEEMSKYVKEVINKYKEQGVNPAAEVSDAAKMQYLLAQLNRLKGAKNDKSITRKKTKRTSNTVREL